MPELEKADSPVFYYILFIFYEDVFCRPIFDPLWVTLLAFIIVAY